MEDFNWQQVFEDFDEQLVNDNRRNNKQSKRKWREIEALKERRRIRRELESFECRYFI